MKNFNEQVIDYAISGLEAIEPDNVIYDDLHNELFNTNYFVIGRYEAEKILESYGVFKAIGEIQEYEKSNFGYISTRLECPEKVCNMLAYIKGQDLLYKLDNELTLCSSEYLDEDEINEMLEWLKQDKITF